MNKRVESLLSVIKILGPHIAPAGEEGPRRIGHCAYCAGPCMMSTTLCDERVYRESHAAR